MNRSVKTRRASANDGAAVVRALVRAFDADPILNYMLRSDAKRAQAFELTFDVAFRQLSLPYGEAWMDEAGDEAALWTPPGKWNHWAAFRFAPSLARAIGLRRMPKIFPALDRVGRRHPTRLHWYLFAIGVDPALQGRGIGSALLAAVLPRCDADRMPAYLEASRPENVRLYERHGFRVLEEVRMAPDAPPLWTMLREANP